MINKFFSVVLLALLSFCPAATLLASDGNERWTYHLAYHDATTNRPTEQGIFALFNGNLLQYQPGDDEVRLFSKADGLNGSEILFMEYVAEAECLILVYDDCLIDLYYPKSGEVVCMPQIKQGVNDGVSINALFTDSKQVMLALSNGIAHIDVQQQEVRGYYTLNENVVAAAIYDNQLFAATQNGLMRCSISANPLDLSTWHTDTSYKNIRQFMHFNGTLYAAANDGLYALHNETLQRIHNGAFTGMYAGMQQAVCHNDKMMLLLSNDANSTSTTYELTQSWQCISMTSDGTFWTTGDNGLQAYKLNNTVLEAQGSPIGGYGPRRDLCYYMHYEGNRLLIAGGRLDPYDRQHYDGTIIMRENGKWSFFQEDSINTQTGVPYRDITCIVQDPNDERHHFASAGGTGIYEFRDFKFVQHYSNHNTPIVSAAGTNPRYVRMDGLQIDDKGNLWMVNNQADTLIRIRKADGTWKGIYIEAVAQAPTCERTLFDSKGRFWVTSRRTVSYHDGGLLCLDFNGTIDNTKDDVSTYRSMVTNQDGTSYELGGAYCLAEDTDGAIWIGTNSGLFVIANPDEWHNEQFRITQIKVPRNDGTNLADYLLNGVAVMAITIDGAGRKWIGTQENGLYLVSHDGTEILEHFDTGNSPLLSNCIYSIAIDAQSGEVLIGTDKGLCAYDGQATQAETELSDDNLKVYPNPVRPEHRQGVTLTGLTLDADIKVVSTGGQVVAAGTSNGGSFTWDACGLDGTRVKPGVYYFLISTADGKKGGTAKVVVI